MPVLYVEKNGNRDELELVNMGVRHTHYVLKEGAEITFRQQWRDQDFRTELDSILAP